MVRQWGEENAGVELEDYTREQAREYGLKYPSRVKFLRAMWNDALRDGLVPSNPFAALRIAKPRKERYFPSTEEVQGLIRAAQEPLRGRIRFSAYTGLRLGEMLAVRPMDFHASERRLEVHWQIDPRGERVERKGKLKKIWVTIPDDATDGLGHIDWVLGFRESEDGSGGSRLLSQAAGSDPTREDGWWGPLAFDARLWPCSRAEHNKEWNALRRALKLPENFVWHSLRHHAATWFLDQGASFEDVAIQLGHSDEGTMVREVYGHRDRGKALDRLEAVVNG